MLLFFSWTLKMTKTSKMIWSTDHKCPIKVLFIKTCRLQAKMKSDRKRMLLFNNCYKIVSGYFFAIGIFIFHKTEVQTVILRCLTGLNYNWFKSYGLRCSWRSLVSLVNFWKIASDKWPILRTHLAFFWKLHDYLWQNWDSEGHFEEKNKNKS